MKNDRMTRPVSLASETDRFLQQVRIDYGPPEILGPFFLKAQRAVEERGISISLGTFDDLLEANIANSENWRPLIAVFDYRNGGVSRENSFCILGRDPHGNVVAAHAARLYDWSHTTYYEEASSLRLFYADPERMKLPGEQCIVTAPSAKTITGQVVFSGAAWYHPTYRGRKLSAIFPKIGKALAFTRWSPDVICSMMIADVHAKGFAPRFDYPVVDWDVQMVNSGMGTWRLALVSMNGLHAIEAARNFLNSFPVEIVRNERYRSA